jgi:hypothetical protein
VASSQIPEVLERIARGAKRPRVGVEKGEQSRQRLQRGDLRTAFGVRVLLHAFPPGARFARPGAIGCNASGVTEAATGPGLGRADGRPGSVPFCRLRAPTRRFMIRAG